MDHPERFCVNEILGCIAWKHLKIADLKCLEEGEDPVDQYDRRSIANALAEAFLTGFAYSTSVATQQTQIVENTHGRKDNGYERKDNG